MPIPETETGVSIGSDRSFVGDCRHLYYICCFWLTDFVHSGSVDIVNRLCIHSGDGDVLVGDGGVCDCAHERTVETV